MKSLDPILVITHGVDGVVITITTNEHALVVHLLHGGDASCIKLEKRS